MPEFPPEGIHACAKHLHRAWYHNVSIFTVPAVPDFDALPEYVQEKWRDMAREFLNAT